MHMYAYSYVILFIYLFSFFQQISSFKRHVLSFFSLYKKNYFLFLYCIYIHILIL
ncbi:hypothetical protein HMPREF3182_00328 [Megasphaera hutchinsoni]|uniref:Uncharacterized protein n=1 Tax=Megasphaera hutchinsoni TaxID=1588748 RepID=A0A134CKD4_9FIRM|nr:hypothetical protein HMPREF3182_00328 [Megasphaera hutchinsoni]